MGFLFTFVHMKAILFVFIGGGIGSVARYLLSKINTLNTIPYGTMLANIIGCFLIGLLLSYAQKSSSLSKEHLLLLATGFCGGFTTFSTFAYEGQTFLKNSDYTSFFLYCGFSFILGLGAVILGVSLGKS